MAPHKLFSDTIDKWLSNSRIQSSFVCASLFSQKAAESALQMSSICFKMHLYRYTMQCCVLPSQVELPLGATEDRICGTIDIEKALQEGIKAYEPGLLVCMFSHICDFIISACGRHHDSVPM